MKKQTKILAMPWLTLVLLIVTSTIKAQTLTVTLTPSNYNNFNISCFGIRNGTITANVSGGTPPYNYEWSNGDNGASIINLAAGFHSVRVTDAANNTVIAEITLEQPEPFRMEVALFTYTNGYNNSLFNACNGSATLVMNGGVSPITYQWSDGFTTQNRTNLCAKNYGVVATDNNGCRVVAERIYLTEPERMDWQNTGNANTNPSVHFLGTTDINDLILKTNNNERFRIKGNGTINFKDYASTVGDRMAYFDANGNLKVGPVNIVIGVPSWNTTGNNLSGLTTEFLGTINNFDLHFRTNNTNRMRITTNGDVAIGNIAPKDKLDVDGRLKVRGSDFRFGTNDSRPTNGTDGLAMVHDNGDIGYQLRYYI